MRRFAFSTGAQNWNLELHQQTPDFEGIEEVLGTRYGYYGDDAEHRRWFED